MELVQFFTVFNCPDDVCSRLSTIPTYDKIMRTLFKLNPNKIQGPDGLTYQFYSASWTSTGAEVTTTIRKVFVQSHMPTATNSTILTLISKFSGATSITECQNS